MKVSKNLKELTTTQTEMAKVLGITQQRVSQMVKENVFVRDDSGSVVVMESLKNFYKFSAEKKEDGELSFDREKALHEKARRELAELKLAELKNDLHRTVDIEIMVGGMITIFKRQMLGLPHKLAPRLAGQSADDINELMTNEITAALTELAAFDVAKLGEYDEDSSEDN